MKRSLISSHCFSFSSKGTWLLFFDLIESVRSWIYFFRLRISCFFVVLLQLTEADSCLKDDYACSPSNSNRVEWLCSDCFGKVYPPLKLLIDLSTYCFDELLIGIVARFVGVFEALKNSLALAKAICEVVMRVLRDSLTSLSSANCCLSSSQSACPFSQSSLYFYFSRMAIPYFLMSSLSRACCSSGRQLMMEVLSIALWPTI